MLSEEIKRKILKGAVPSVVGLALTVRHLGAIFAELRNAEGKIKQEYAYLDGIKLWDVSTSDVKIAGDVDFSAVPPRVFLAHYDEAKRILYIVEAEYPAPP